MDGDTPVLLEPAQAAGADTGRAASDESTDEPEPEETQPSSESEP